MKISIYNPTKLLNVYNVVRALRKGEIYLPDLTVPKVTSKELERIFLYFADQGVVKSAGEDLYAVMEQGVKTMNARIESLKIRKERLAEKVKRKAREARRRVSGE